MKAVILAAGEGTRMRPMTYTRPKVMLPLANRPILEHLLIEINQTGITEFVFVVGYHDEQVRDYFKSGAKWGVNIVYVNQRKQQGTADAVKMVESSVVDGNFLLLNGDVIVNSQDLKKVVAAQDTTLGVVKVKDAIGLGVVELKGSRITRIHEKTPKPPSNIANAGVYLFTPEIFGVISRTAKSPRGEYEITDSLQLMIDEGHNIYRKELTSWLDLSYPWDLLPANEYLLGDNKVENLGEIEDNVVLKGKVSIGEGTVVRSGTYIVGPVIIGQNCDIGPNCYIRASTAIEDDCHIGSAVEVKNSIIMRGSKIPHHNYVGDSIIGEACNFGAGTKIANLRLDKQDIWVAGLDTKRRKLGAIIGDRVETGINACINVGSSIGNNTFIGPGALASGVISPNSKIL
jgi:bifunctional UDP-N-acetylglucosamine pyrophosphorylase/glucosamine-1-phosphate N-acetyltransferase